MILSAGLFFLLLVLLAAIGGLMFEIIERTKESNVGGDGRMVVKGSNAVVQTASSDLTLENGVLVVRGNANRRRQGCGENETCPAEPIKTAANSEFMGLSSLMSVDNLGEMKNMKIGQGNSFILFNVLAVARYEDPTARHGSVLVLYTHLGVIILDGTAVMFEERLANTFSRAGLQVDPSTNRRLLGVVDVLGMFNMINRAAKDNPELDGAGPAMLPTYFKANITTLDLCEYEGSDTYCNVPGTVDRHVDWVSVMGSATDIAKQVRVLESHQEMFSMNINSQPIGVTTTTRAQWPEQSMSVVQNATHKLKFQTFKGHHYFCTMEESNELAQVTQSRRKLQQVSALARRAASEPVQGRQGVSVASLGFATVDDVYCQQFEIVETGFFSGRRVTLFENYAQKRVQRIEFEIYIWRFDNLVPLEANESPLHPADFDIDFIFGDCDPVSLIPPPTIAAGLTSDIIKVDSSWGTVQTRRAGARRSVPSEKTKRQGIVHKSLEQYKQDKHNSMVWSGFSNSTLRRSSQSASATLSCSGGCGCEPQTMITSGAISDGSGASNYANGQSCTWIISSESEISLTLTSFDTEASYDFVKISTCETASSCIAPKLVASLSGSDSSGNVFISTTGGLLIVFTSDSGVTAAGWAATWNIPTAQCSGFDFDAPKMGIATNFEYCPALHAEFGMSVDVEAVVKTIEELKDGWMGPVIKPLWQAIGAPECLCPKIFGEMLVKVPFANLEDAEAGGKISATFDVGCCLQWYGPAFGIAPQVGTMMEQLGTSIGIELGVELAEQTETCSLDGRGEYGHFPKNPFFYSKATFRAIESSKLTELAEEYEKKAKSALGAATTVGQSLGGKVSDAAPSSPNFNDIFGAVLSAELTTCVQDLRNGVGCESCKKYVLNNAGSSGGVIAAGQAQLQKTFGRDAAAQIEAKICNIQEMTDQLYAIQAGNYLNPADWLNGEIQDVMGQVCTAGDAREECACVKKEEFCKIGTDARDRIAGRPCLPEWCRTRRRALSSTFRDGRRLWQSSNHDSSRRFFSIFQAVVAIAVPSCDGCDPSECPQNLFTDTCVRLFQDQAAAASAATYAGANAVAATLIEVAEQGSAQLASAVELAATTAVAQAVAMAQAVDDAATEAEKAAYEQAKVAYEQAQQVVAETTAQAIKLSAEAWEARKLLSSALDALSGQVDSVWGDIKGGLTVEATGWARTIQAPTLRCPDKKDSFSLGLSVVMGISVKAFGFEHD